MTTLSCCREVRALFQQAGNPEIAQQQMAYLKGKFEFFGLKMPSWMAITKAFHKAHGIPEGEALLDLVRICYEDDHREMHYFALETLQKSLKSQPESIIYFLEELILKHSWWDSVDWLNKLVGLHFKKYPHLIQPVTERWMASGNIWLQRVCMIFQLPYKEKTDSELLFNYVRQLSGSKEFFIQKGAGWALRQYAKTNPEAVRLFISQNTVAPLTRREASKYLID